MKNQKDLPAQAGVTLIITFMVMALMLAIVISLSVILFREINMISNIGSSISSFYAAEAGAEKTLYFDAKQVPPGATRGFCGICNSCGAGCVGCTAIPLDDENVGCNVNTCNNCKITYTSIFDGRSYKVGAQVTPHQADPSKFIFDITSRGHYRNSIRAVNLNLLK